MLCLFSALLCSCSREDTPEESQPGAPSKSKFQEYRHALEEMGVLNSEEEQRAARSISGEQAQLWEQEQESQEQLHIRLLRYELSYTSEGDLKNYHNARLQKVEAQREERQKIRNLRLLDTAEREQWRQETENLKIENYALLEANLETNLPQRQKQTREMPGRDRTFAPDPAQSGELLR